MKKFALIVMIFSLGCSDFADPPKGEGWFNNGNNNGNNNGSNNGSNNNGTNNGTNGTNNGTIFGPLASLSVVNTGVSSVWYTESFAVIGEDGVPVSINDCFGNRDFAAFVQELRPGQALELDWRGENLDRGCESAAPLTSGSFELEFCYSLNVNSGFNETVSAETYRCETRRFDLEESPDVSIEISFDARDSAREIEFVLTNASGQPVWYDLFRGCAANGWLTISDGVRNLSTDGIDFCGVCDCSAGDGCAGACPACVATLPEELVAGGLVSGIYNGLYTDGYSPINGTDGPMCSQTQLAPHALEAVVCYQFAEPLEGEGLTTATCETVQFTVEDDVVEVVIDPLPTLG